MAISIAKLMRIASSLPIFTLYEQIFLVFMMCTAACLFGLILGELQEIFATSYARRRDEDEHMEAVISFLHENRCFVVLADFHFLQIVYQMKMIFL